MGGLSALLALLLATAALLPPAGCASRPPGFYYTVKPGDNLYRIGLRFGVPTETLVRVNHISDVRELRVGTRLWIPADARAARARPAPPARRAALDEARRRARSEVQSEAKLAFFWPVQGRLSSPFGRRGGRPHEGIDLSAPRGTPVRAAEAGKVIHAGRLRDYGKVVVVKHAGAYRSVYAHLDSIAVREGQFVERGQPIGRVGETGNATGPHLHFEIRRGPRPRNPILYLP
jgi:murein DD-endopeptidase MepM/ murein hydrolase activator NlpD